MSQIDRRHFLQFTGTALASLGLSQLTLERRAIRYARSLAQNTPRKIALLVGINDYAAPGTEQLYGPTTDVELQRQLLIHRFGFLPQDIHILTNNQATRQNILAAYEEYLIGGVKPGDVAVFHFSGHGGRVREIDRCDAGDKACQNSTLVPYDFNETTDTVSVQDIMGHTRFLLDANVPTDNLTVILDCCYAGGGKRGNVIVRSRNTESQIRENIPPLISPAEWDYQEQWLSRLNWTREEFIQKRQQGLAKGIAIASAKENQKAADYSFEGFYAGAFTYLLVQHLWQQVTPQAISQVVKYVERGTAHLSNHSQKPEYEPTRGKAVNIDPAFQINHYHSPPGEAVVLEVWEGDRVKLWLGGLDIQSLIAFDRGAVFTLLDREGNSKGEVIQDSPRQKLTTTGKIQLHGDRAPSVGDILQEKARQIPDRIRFQLGIDPAIAPTFQPLAAKLQTQLPFLEFLPLQTGEAVQAILSQQEGRTGLFNNLLEPLEYTLGNARESIAEAIARLQIPLQRLHLGRMLRLLLNPATTHLNITATIATKRRGSVIAIAPRSRGESQLRTIPIEEAVKTLPVGTKVQVRLRNDEPKDLYISMLVIDARGAANLLFPYQWENPDEQSLLNANKTLDLPWLEAAEPYGLAELLIVASLRPLRQTFKVMKRSYRNDPIAAPEEVITALFADLNAAAIAPQGRKTDVPSASTASTLDTQQLATLSLLYNIVEA